MTLDEWEREQRRLLGAHTRALNRARRLPGTTLSEKLALLDKANAALKALRNHRLNKFNLVKD